MTSEILAELERLKKAQAALSVILPGEDGTEFEIERMQVFLTRVFRTPPAAIKITGNPETDENTDLLTSKLDPEDVAEGYTNATLCKATAIEIYSILAGFLDVLPSGKPDIEKGKAMFREFVAHPAKLYP